MKSFEHVLGLTALLLCAGACQKDASRLTSSNNNRTVVQLKNDSNTPGWVITSSNQVAGNRLLVYSRSSAGTLSYYTSVETGGTGTGGGLGNQGALVVSEDGRFLLAVNAGSNSITSFKIDEGITKISTLSSGGLRPVSITQYGNMVFVLNAGGDGNVTGFQLDDDGELSPIAGSTRPLSSTMAGAAQISFVQNGKVLVITEKATNKIISYTVDALGQPGIMHYIMSSNPTPFGFAVSAPDKIFVSEAVGGAPGASTLSSYSVAPDGSLSLVEGPIGAGQAAACWVVIGNNGKYAYTTNTASNTITSFGISKNTGSVNVAQAVAATTQAGPIDAAISNGGKYLYVLAAAGHSIEGFGISADGSLSPVGNSPGLPAGATGLVAK